jgi:hypothetical protein
LSLREWLITATPGGTCHDVVKMWRGIYLSVGIAASCFADTILDGKNLKSKTCF